MPLIRSGPPASAGPLNLIPKVSKPDAVKLNRGDRLLAHPARTVTVGFLLAVLVSTGLLMLPLSSAGPGGSSFRVALFTATSAVSVTGLAVVDTAEYWSTFGEALILAMIQLGGLGIMTATSLLGLVVARRLGLRSRLLVQAETGALDLGTIRRLLFNVVRISLLIEVVTWLALTLRLSLGYDEAFGRAVYLGLFHAVSAYNNGGLALWSDSLVRFGGDPWLLTPIVVAFLLGALGFPVLLELLRGRTPNGWSVHTRLTLVTYGVLVLVGPAIVLFGEWNNESSLGVHGSAAGRLVAGTFSGLVAGSAGFNVIDYGAVNPSTLLGTDLLMFIGGGSGGTAGGIKVGTVAVLALAVISEIRGDTDVEAFGRRLTTTTLRQALSVAMLAMTGILVGTFLLLATSPVSFDAGVFEVISAFSNSGLSTGITGQLPDPAQYLLTALMFIGRVGPVTVATALALRQARRLYRYPETRPLVG
ncbi:MAG TPA: potassium transporter TrkG [Kineosporiaceae bacterium]|nr:potassium transporter TrkG [Kineosporiaceae bacterium]